MDVRRRRDGPLADAGGRRALGTGGGGRVRVGAQRPALSVRRGGGAGRRAGGDGPAAGRAKNPRQPVPVEHVGLDGQEIPLDDASCDAALFTFTLCTVPDPVQALREVQRVLRPGGNVHFLEHGLSPTPASPSGSIASSRCSDGWPTGAISPGLVDPRGGSRVRDAAQRAALRARTQAVELVHDRRCDEARGVKPGPPRRPSGPLVGGFHAARSRSSSSPGPGSGSR